ncbi:unannotated protein [freshwater metagenome]|uniref:Unannotated protein n=1 Tax=freshwater metagenome TaxID=449393 RepID=A0A6J5ZTN7_9ZZZZ
MPPAAIPAPMRPPMMACDEDEGSPRAHVRKFQKIAPKSAANVTFKPIGIDPAATAGRLSIATVLEMVLATAVPIMNAGKKLNMAERMTALRGVSDLVAITVDVALAAS